MSHVFRLSDEEYAQLAAYAAQHEQTPEALFQAWLRAITHNADEPTRSLYANQRHHEEQEESMLNSPLLQVAGIFAIGEPGWADRHDEYLAEGYLEDHASNE